MAILTQYWGLDGLLLIFFGLIGAYLYLVRNFKYWKKRGVKEAPPSAIFGNFGECFLGKKPLVNVLQDLYECGEDEPYLGFYVVDRPYLLLRDPELIKHVLIKDFSNFTGRVSDSHKTDTVGKLNLFVLRNPHWKYVRQKLSPIFTSGRLKKMFELMLEIEKDLDVHLKSVTKEGKLDTNLEMRIDIFITYSELKSVGALRTFSPKCVSIKSQEYFFVELLVTNIFWLKHFII